MNRKTLLRRAAVAATALATVTTLTASAFAQPGQPADAPNDPAVGPWREMILRHGQGMKGMQGMPGMQGMRDMRRMRGGDGAGGGIVQHLLANAADIGLTDAQQDQLRQVRRRALGVMMPKRQAVAEAQLDFHDLMDKNKATSAELRSAHDKVLKSRNELEAAMFDLHMQVRDILTPEQRDKIHGAMREHLRRGDGPGMKKSGGGGHSDKFDSGDNGDGDGDDDDDSGGGGDGAGSPF